MYLLKRTMSVRILFGYLFVVCCSHVAIVKKRLAYLEGSSAQVTMRKPKNEKENKTCEILSAPFLRKSIVWLNPDPQQVQDQKVKKYKW